MVFVGPYEHHSNLLPWHELGSQVIQIRETADGLVDLVDLERQLQVSLMFRLAVMTLPSCIV